MSAPSRAEIREQLNEAAQAPSHANGEPKKPFKPQYPLLSLEDTRQNAVCIAFLLGVAFTLGLVNAASLFGSSSQEIARSAAGRFVHAVRSPRLGIYVAMLVVFHMAEFLTTAIYNPSKANVRCERWRFHI
jgi:hypothetical protein